MTLNQLIDLLRKAFSDDEIKKGVLDEEWYKKNIESKIDSTGFCFSASEIIYRICGGKSQWKSMSIPLEKWGHGPHRFLINKETNEILDITNDQYTGQGIDIPYDKARPVPFRIKSKKAVILANKIGVKIP